MASCIFDNPLTRRREGWIGERIVAAVSAELFPSMLPLLATTQDVWKLDEPFEAGRIVFGDPAAIPTAYRPPERRKGDRRIYGGPRETPDRRKAPTTTEENP